MTVLKINIKTLRKYLRYDPDTGIIYWKLKTSINGPNLIDKPAGTLSKGYVRICIFNKRLMGHRIAWAMYYGRWPKRIIDHINGIKNDNRINNLREVSLRENSRNNEKHRKGHLPGTTFHKTNGKWSASIRLHLGYFDTPEEAHDMFIKKCEQMGLK